MSVWTTPDDARYVPLAVLQAADLNNIEGNLARLVDRFRSAVASADLTLTTSYQNVTGASVTLDHDGVWFVLAIAYYFYDATDAAASSVLNVQIDVGGSAQTGTGKYRGPAIDTGHMLQAWPVTVAGAPKTAKLQAQKGTGGGASFIRQTTTKLFAFWMSA